MKKLLVELVQPVGLVYRCAIGTQTWPSNWKCEHGILAHKIPHPQTLDDIRSLGLTRNLSKGLEWILLTWLYPYITPTYL